MRRAAVLRGGGKPRVDGVLIGFEELNLGGGIKRDVHGGHALGDTIKDEESLDLEDDPLPPPRAAALSRAQQPAVANARVDGRVGARAGAQLGGHGG